MSVNEKMMNIIALAMSIKATNSQYLAIDWNGNYPNYIVVWVHKKEDEGVVEKHTYGGDDGNFFFDSYESMTTWLNSLKREWGDRRKNQRQGNRT